ncbi:SHOCT domain-containing protein [Jeotgalibacillus soli]|uniref:SHOCT domain-containing protein n=1 Tax=Jeotgalibacillus soli TaxID=889306 RepID=A0A0C2VMA6_9BACL|nr:hypothetical protein [Jeotgalibacillus soli]KIL50012.1 hypothetical protein KP78_14800 [Jeotgalibacillus soli]
MMGGMIDMNGIGIFNMIMWILILAVLFFGVFRLFSRESDKKEDRALSLLKEKFANGDINEEEYKSKKVLLSRD